MATSDQEQKSVLVPQHKRIAQGEPLNGASYGPTGKAPARSPGKREGGLSHIKGKK